MQIHSFGRATSVRIRHFLAVRQIGDKLINDEDGIDNGGSVKWFGCQVMRAWTRQDWLVYMRVS